MITIFHRKELVTTYSMKEQAEIRNYLAAAGIDYLVKVENMTGNVSRSRGMTGSYGQSPQYDNIYVIYVHKKNYEEASELIGRGRVKR